MAVRYHGCTCHLRYSAANNLQNKKAENAASDKEAADEATEAKEDKEEENKSQPWYFHVVASVILVVHGLTFLVPHDPETEDTDMMRIIGRWFGFDWEWMKHFTPYAQVCCSVFLLAAVRECYQMESLNLSDFLKCGFRFLLQGLAAVFNISLGIVSWWTSKESERYNRLIQLRVFVFCVNILHAYITGPIIYQNDDTPMLAPGKLHKNLKNFKTS